MAKVSQTIVNKGLRDRVFKELIDQSDNEEVIKAYRRINDRQYGVILTDANGEQRYVRIGAIVAELREDMTAEELMQAEINDYNVKQATKETKAQERATKAAADKARRAAKEE